MFQKTVAAFRPLCPFGVVASLFAIAGCGGDSSHSSSGASTGTAVVQATDAAFQDLSSLEMTINAIDFIDTTGGAVRVFPPASNPGATATMDLVTLESIQPVIAVAELPPNTFNGARIGFQDVTATDSGGTAQAVTTPGNTLQVTFAEPVSVNSGGVSRVLLDFDGAASVVSTGPGSLTFSPVVFEVSRQSETSVTDLDGRVVSIGQQRFTLAPSLGPAGNTQPSVSSTQAFELGEIDVVTDANTRFVVNGAPSNGEAGFAQLAAGDQVQVSGNLVNDAVAAQFVTVNRAGSSNPVTVRGTVISTGPAPGTATLIVNRIVRDANSQLTVQPGEALEFTMDSSTNFLRRTGAEGFNPNRIFPGTSVEVIGSMSGPTLDASMVELRETTLSGTISDLVPPHATMAVEEINGLPASQVTGVANPRLHMEAADHFIDGFVPTTAQTVAGGQNLVTRGVFTEPNQFESSTVSVNESQEFTATGPFTTNAAGNSFTVNMNGSPVNVMLSPSTRLFSTQAGQTGSISNSTAPGFLDEMNQAATGTVSFRGFESGGEIQASRAGLQMP